MEILLGSYEEVESGCYHRLQSRDETVTYALDIEYIPNVKKCP